MRPMLIALLAVLPIGVGAQETWVSMSGAEITEGLTGNVLDYDNAVQDFRVSGRTLYNAGRDSWGYWAVRGDQYCSMWPPSDLWACYDMARSGDRIRFIGEAGDTIDGVVREAID